jgi:hypothetical protein
VRAVRVALGVLGMGVLVVFLIGLSAAWAGFLVMLLCGALWHTFNILKPIGFLPSLGIGFLLACLGALFRGSSS